MNLRSSPAATEQEFPPALPPAGAGRTQCGRPEPRGHLAREAALVRRLGGDPDDQVRVPQAPFDEAAGLLQHLPAVFLPVLNRMFGYQGHEGIVPPAGRVLQGSTRLRLWLRRGKPTTPSPKGWVAWSRRSSALSSLPKGFCVTMLLACLGGIPPSPKGCSRWI